MMLETAAGSTAGEVLAEDEVRDVLADMHAPYRIPTDWLVGSSHAVAAYTHDPVMAALAADELSRRELGDAYPVAAGSLVVEGPIEVVLTGTGRTSVGYRQARTGDEYALLMCVVRPGRLHRPVLPTVVTDLVDVTARSWGWQ